MPNVIANEIIGIQPIQPMTGQFFELFDRNIIDLGNLTYSIPGHTISMIDNIKTIDKEYSLELEYSSRENRTIIKVKDNIKKAMFVFYVSQYYKIKKLTNKEIK